MTFKDNWCTCNPPINNTEGNIIVYDGRLNCEYNIFIPINDNNITPKEPAWIDFRGKYLTACDNRFSGEEFNRCCLNWKTKYDTATFPGMSFKRNLIGFTGENSCGVRLFNFPNYMYINNNYYGALTNFLVGFTDTSRTSLIDGLNEIKNNYYLNYALNAAAFSSNKFNLFNYNIDNNNIYSVQYNPNDFLLNECANDWYFLAKNYKTNCYYFEKQTYLLTERTDLIGQNILFMQDNYTDGARNVKLPISNLNNTTIKINFNFNTQGSNYNITQSIYTSIVKYYDAANGGVKHMIKYKNLFEDYSTDSPATIKVGVYDENGNYHFDDALPDKYKGIALQIPGTNVTIDSITIEN